MLACRSYCDEVENPLRFGMNRPARRDDECDEIVVFCAGVNLLFKCSDAFVCMDGNFVAGTSRGSSGMVEYFEGMLLPQELPASASQTGQTAEYYGMINRFGANKTATSLSGMGRFSVMGEGQQQVLMMGVLNGTKVVATGTTDYWAAAAVAADQGDIHHQQETCQLVPGATAQDFMSKCLYSPADAASLDSFKAVLPTGSLDSTRWKAVQNSMQNLSSVSVCFRDSSTLVTMQHPSWTGLQSDAVRFEGRNTLGIAGTWRDGAEGYGSFVAAAVLEPASQGGASQVMRAVACDSAGNNCQEFVLEHDLSSANYPSGQEPMNEGSDKAVGGGAGPALCHPSASPPPMDQYDSCPAQGPMLEHADEEAVAATTRMYVCPATIRPARSVGIVTQGAEPGMTQDAQYHCVDYDASGKPIFVKGTYSMMGYFEGAIDGHEGSVAWYEAAGLNRSSPSSGYAWLTYSFLMPSSGAAGSSNDSTSVHGIYWGSDDSGTALNMSEGANWVASGCVEAQGASTATMRSMCLWTPQGQRAVMEIGTPVDGAGAGDDDDGVGGGIRGLNGVKFFSNDVDEDEIEVCTRESEAVGTFDRKYGADSCNSTANCSISNVVNSTLKPGSVQLRLRDAHGLAMSWMLDDGALVSGVYVSSRVGESGFLHGWECEARGQWTERFNESVLENRTRTRMVNATGVRPVTTQVSREVFDPKANQTTVVVENVTTMENATGMEPEEYLEEGVYDVERIVEHPPTRACRSREYRQSSRSPDCRDILRRSCVLSMDWLGVRSLMKRGMAYSGGLGKKRRIVPETNWGRRAEYRVWACLRDWDSQEQMRCGAGPHQLACFMFDEEAREFEFWGPNTAVRAVEQHS